MWAPYLFSYLSQLVCDFVKMIGGDSDPPLAKLFGLLTGLRVARWTIDGLVLWSSQMTMFLSSSGLPLPFI
jgi:hypothetical protein